MEPTPNASTRRRLRIRLRTAVVLVAALALMLTVLVPWVKRVWFPSTWNRWIVKTVTRPDGTIVRLRIRRHPTGDDVFEEILAGPPKDAAANAQRPSAKPSP